MQMLAQHAARYITARECGSIARLSGRSCIIKILNYKLSSRPNVLKFHQLVCELSRINPNNTDYDRKLGVMAPLIKKKSESLNSATQGLGHSKAGRFNSISWLALG